MRTGPRSLPRRGSANARIALSSGRPGARSAASTNGGAACPRAGGGRRARSQRGQVPDEGPDRRLGFTRQLLGDPIAVGLGGVVEGADRQRRYSGRRRREIERRPVAVGGRDPSPEPWRAARARSDAGP